MMFTQPHEDHFLFNILESFLQGRQLAGRGQPGQTIYTGTSPTMCSTAILVEDTRKTSAFAPCQC